MRIEDVKHVKFHTYISECNITKSHIVYIYSYRDSHITIYIIVYNTHIYVYIHTAEHIAFGHWQNAIHNLFYLVCFHLDMHLIIPYNYKLCKE